MPLVGAERDGHGACLSLDGSSLPSPLLNHLPSSLRIRSRFGERLAFASDPIPAALETSMLAPVSRLMAIAF